MQNYKILLPINVDEPFDYTSGEELAVGDFVRVPFRSGEETSVVWKKAEAEIPASKIKPVIGKLPLPPLKKELVKFIEWVAEYNMTPLGMALKMVISIKFTKKDLSSPLEGERVLPSAKPWGERGYSPTLTNHAQEMRKTPTPWEQKLWQKLNNNQLGYKFRRQQPIENYIADFYNPEKKLVIEVDGGQHNESEYDRIRDEELCSKGFRILRFWNNEIDTNIDGILTRILATLESSPHRTSEAGSTPPQGGNITTLSAPQSEAAGILRDKVKTAKFAPTVLDGVTGSGKTEVYFEAIDEALAEGKQVLVMLPEIALSHQWLSRFKKRFGFEPGIWHSDRTPKQRRETWLDVALGACRVVVGARSALFLPFRNLALIVVDEEHDQSYKQEEGVIYHGRDMAVVRASLEHIPVVLVSATPSVETVNNLNEGKYELLHLPERYGGATMPDIEIVDMRREKLKSDHFISAKLRELLTHGLNKNLQSILFLNRRGYAPLLLCRACGYRFQCPNCSAWLVTHKFGERLECHHCGHQAAIPKECPECKVEDKLHACGPGVERLKEEVMEYFPTARVEVMASDSPKSADEIVNRMITHDIDILIGTQMIAKGHHFPKLSLVGVVDADLGLEGGDLRAMERTYQILHQVSGRAGREADIGRVIVQTYNPDNLVMQAIAQQKRDEFIERELIARQRFSMPPFGRLASIVVSSKNEKAARKFITDISLSAPHATDVTLLGPAPAPLSFLRGEYRYRLIVKAPKKFNIQRYIKALLARHKTPSGIKTRVDIDPFSFV